MNRWLPKTLAALVVPVSLVTTVWAQEPKSGYEFMSEDARAMQDDPFENLGMLHVEAGRELFHRVMDNGKSCASCHGENGAGLDPGRIAAYPVYDEETNKPLTLQGRIHRCWTDAGRLDNFPLVYDSSDAVDLETFVRYLARGEKVNVDISGPMRLYYEAGRVLYHKRLGQFDMACANCHVHNAGRKLRGQTLSQGQSNGFPEYRLGSGRLTSLHRRFTECYLSFRADPWEPGADDFINLEVYVNARGNGLPIETPAVRY